MTNKPDVVRLADYAPPDHTVTDVALAFDIHDDHTDVVATLACRRQGEPDAPLVLDGEDLELRGLALDGRELGADEYTVGAEALTVHSVPDTFELIVTTRLHPDRNTRLEGLYRSGGIYCTQCEAQGFRRITYFPDRPDVMARYTVTIEANRATCPVLLSNGNRVEEADAGNGRHRVRWVDPFPKPSYLFALVAGDLHCHRDRHTTPSGREVELALYVEHADSGRTAHAMNSLKAAMAWDERVYGLECDLDNYQVVAVSDFNMGAMENKGLNIFNTACALADEKTATDADYTTIEAVIAHEYFHNWSGNRVTLRDWFQLSLKEGFTVFREQQFSADMGAPAVHRIDQVRTLRAAQFPEDAGPTAHPVRPAEFVQINNFYTATVYMKGAEVIRMYHTLLGEEGFLRGARLYFDRHDGDAVTCDDFLAAMAEANDTDLSQFALWYSQAGTPVVTVDDDYDARARRYTLTLRQRVPATPGQPDKAPMQIPVRVGLLDGDGREMPVNPTDPSALATDHVINLREPELTVIYEDVPERPVPSLLRGFSAPVDLHYDYNDEQLAFLFAHDGDEFNRWEAGQRLMTRTLLQCVTDTDAEPLPDHLLEAFRRTLLDRDTDPALVAEALTLPAEAFLADRMDVVDIDGIHRAREALRRRIAERMGQELRARYDELAVDAPYQPTEAQMGPRRLRNTLLGYLAAPADDDARRLCARHYDRSHNMTDTMAALSLLADVDDDAASERLDGFYRHWRDTPLVVDKWLRVQAMARRADTLDNVKRLMAHEAFDIRNPNKVRALIGAFANGNPARFHAANGSGYAFLAERVIELDAINPQIAARLVTPLSRWRRFDAARAARMQEALGRISERDALSKDVYEMVSRSLADTD